MVKPTALIQGEGLFVSTYAPDRRAAAEREASGYDLEIRAFGVALETVDEMTTTATSWRKVEGWSTWIRPLGMFQRQGHTTGHRGAGSPAGDKP